jgi:hypothetical protein
MSKQPTGLLFDSDVLLKLGQHPANMDAIAAISKAVKNGEYSLIVPEPVNNAFMREATTAPERYWKSRRTSLQHMKSLADVSHNPTDFQKHVAALESSLGSSCGYRGTGRSTFLPSKRSGMVQVVNPIR